MKIPRFLPVKTKRPWKNRKKSSKMHLKIMFCPWKVQQITHVKAKFTRVKNIVYYTREKINSAREKYGKNLFSFFSFSYSFSIPPQRWPSSIIRKKRLLDLKCRYVQNWNKVWKEKLFFKSLLTEENVHTDYTIDWCAESAVKFPRLLPCKKK